MLNYKEEKVVDYLVRRVEEEGGGARPIIYRGRKGCADYLITFKFNQLFLVECKRPKGGKISVHQAHDCQWLDGFGIHKVYLYTKEAVDNWLKLVLR